jgi:phosphonoacetaldehyde hydrolase
MPEKQIPAVFMDWAGTVVDHGSLAPVNALENIFNQFGAAAPQPLIRRYMGLAKKDHIRKLLQEPEINERWTALHHAPAQERDVEAMYANFEPEMMEVLAGYSTVISGVVEAVETMRARGMKIAGTTGYTRPMLDSLEALAAKQGIAPIVP